MKRSVMVWSLALAGAGVVVGASWSGCGNDSGSPDVRTTSRPAGATGPTTAEILAKDTPALPKDVEAIPDLGLPSATKDPKTGEVWQVYSNGLAYQDKAVGVGPVPRVGQEVKVQYVGTLPESGEVFDASKPDKPFSFMLGTKGIIAGWNMAVSTMHVGGKRKIRVPAAVAYGVRGSPPKIKPGQTLIFEITLLGVSGKAPATAPSVAQSLPAATQIGPPTPPAGTQ